jgi:aspartate-semialdehyde dehydrogenase
MPDWAAEMPVLETTPGLDADIVFSALPTDLATALEPEFAQAGHQVFSNASSYRMASDVPLLIPRSQRRTRRTGSIPTPIARLERLYRDQLQLHPRPA